MMGKKKIIAIGAFFLIIGVVLGSFSTYAYEAMRKGGDNISTSCHIEGSGEIKKTLEESLGKDNPEVKSAMAYIKFKEIKSDFTPAGIPDVYGQELDISFDKVQDAINKVSVFDPTYGSSKINLTGGDLEKYIDIGSKIACEYCCGAATLVFGNGEAACGCAHSQMMRGLAAYLIKNHSQEFTNEQILNQLTEWKKTYFPKETLSVELNRMIKGGDAGIEQMLKEFPDFLPQMVGGC